MFSLFNGECLFCVLAQTVQDAGEKIQELFDPWSSTATPEPMMSKVALGLFVVLALILLFAYFAKRFFKFSPSRKSQGRMRVLETMPLGGKRMIQIIKVNERHLVVGVTGERIELLTELPEEEIDASGKEESEKGKGKAGTGFGDILPFRIQKPKTEKTKAGGIEP